MRLSAALIALSAGFAHASFFGSSDQVTVNEDLKIPGDSPLELCPKAHDKDILHIESVDLVPNPPKAYVTSIVTASTSVRPTVAVSRHYL